ncbi:MAG TPA: crosslink repair DNA glycosylase YcaQ family protein [Candidatus Limnocylindrales bacterium]|jgi:hypothetical protein
MAVRISRDQLVRYRARVGHLDRKLAPGSFAEAAWCGLQDSVPRGGVISLHARVEDTRPESWEHPSLAQIWFRGGADYLVPRVDAGIFTLGSYPRDAEEAARLERLADAIHDVTAGETLKVSQVSTRVKLDHPTEIRRVAVTGRAHIRWDASNIWLIPVERPAIDAGDARRDLARRHLRGFGPSTVKRLATWTGVSLRDAAETWQEIEAELVEVAVADIEESRFVLASDVDALRAADHPLAGTRLLPFDDAFTKLDRDLLVADAEHRDHAFPPVGTSRGYIPGAVLIDGEIVGVWQRQQRTVAIHAWKRLSAASREFVEAEALAFPIAGSSRASVSWV